MSIAEITAIVGSSLAIGTFINLLVYNLYFLPRFNKEIKKIESDLRQIELIKQERWKLKKTACLNALNVADAILSNYKYQNVDESNIKKQSINTEDVRRCFNELACTCDDIQVIIILKKILFESPSPDIIVDLRNAVRNELGFGNVVFDLDREKAFIGKVITDI